MDHEILFKIIARRISCQSTLRLFGEIIKGYPSGGGIRGIPIGNLTSQLFANIYLNEFDHFVKDKLRIKYYLRYTDDFVIVHNNPVELVSLLPVIRKFLRDKLALELHLKKIILRKARQGIDFLGYVVLLHYRVLRTKTKRRILRRITAQDSRETARTFSYLGLLKHCKGFRLGQQIIPSDH